MPIKLTDRDKALLFNRFGRGLVHMGAQPIPPAPPIFVPLRVWTSSKESLAATIAALALDAPALYPNTPAPAAYYVPVDIDRPFDLAFFLYIGDDAQTGLVQMGLMDLAGDLIAQSTVRPALTIGTLALIDAPHMTIPPGPYYIVLAGDTATDNYAGWDLSASAGRRAVPAFLRGGALPLPTSSPGVGDIGNFLPLIGLAETSP